MTQLLYSIGDIHGCHESLHRLLKVIHNDRQGNPAKIVFLGDYVDRGPDSWEVVAHLDFLRRNPEEGVEYVFLKGNHEDMMLNHMKSYDADFLRNGGQKTLRDFNDHNAHLTDFQAFWDGLVRYHQHGDFFFVHAGLSPNHIGLEQALETNNWGDPLLWDRYYNDYDGVFYDNLFVIHGHTPVYNITYKKNQINIDTGCVFGRSYSEYGNLTAIRLDGRTPKDITVFQTREFELGK